MSYSEESERLMAYYRKKYNYNSRKIALRMLKWNFKWLFKDDIALERGNHYPYVAVATGIGDALWSFVLIPALLKKLNTKK